MLSSLERERMAGRRSVQHDLVVEARVHFVLQQADGDQLVHSRERVAQLAVRGVVSHVIASGRFLDGTPQIFSRHRSDIFLLPGYSLS